MTPRSAAPLIRLAVRAPWASTEIVLAALLELAPGGLEQVDGGEWVEYALYGRTEELPDISDGPGEIRGAPVTVRRDEVPDDWSERWKRFHRPRLVGERVYLRPPWEAEVVAPGVAEIVIDPGQAFGTGGHATTRLCLELMLQLEERGSFADLGCGSGVLAIAAVKLGFAPVAAFDADLEALAASAANARANQVVLERLERLDLRATPAPRADVLAANLIRPLLLRVAELIGDWRPAALIASGLLDREVDEVAAAFAPLRERGRRSDQGWSAALLAP